MPWAFSRPSKIKLLITNISQQAATTASRGQQALTSLVIGPPGRTVDGAICKVGDKDEDADGGGNEGSLITGQCSTGIGWRGITKWKAVLSRARLFVTGLGFWTTHTVI